MRIISGILKILGILLFIITFVLGLIHYTVTSVDPGTSIAYDVWGLPTKGRNSLVHNLAGFIGFWAGIAMGYGVYSLGSKLSAE